MKHFTSFRNPYNLSPNKFNPFLLSFKLNHMLKLLFIQIVPPPIPPPPPPGLVIDEIVFVLFLTALFYGIKILKR